MLQDYMFRCVHLLKKPTICQLFLLYGQPLRHGMTFPFSDDELVLFCSRQNPMCMALVISVFVCLLLSTPRHTSYGTVSPCIVSVFPWGTNEICTLAR